jgi:hypothetical protein
VDLDTSRVAVIDAQLLTDSTRDAFVEAERQRLLGTLPSPSDRSTGLISYAFMESRSEAEFTSEVSEYIQAVASDWFAVVATPYVEEETSELVVVLVNDSPSNFDDVVLEIIFPLSADYIYARRRDAKEYLEPPESPRAWSGSRYDVADVLYPVVPQGLRDPVPELETRGDDETLVRFPKVDVRPRTRHPLERLLLALPPELAGKTLELSWRVTSRSAEDDLSGTVEFVIPASEATASTGG